MELIVRYVTPPSQCGYLPERDARYEHELVAEVSPAEYSAKMRQGWRRFGQLLFRPQCEGCTACHSIRVVAAQFQPDRSQRRNRKLNEEAVQLEIGEPAVTGEKLALYDRYHAHQSVHKGWRDHELHDVTGYSQTFVENPYPIEEWCYRIDGRLVGVGYVDRLPAGLSAAYFFYDPDERQRGLGTWNVLNVIARTAELGLPHAYLGYHVAGSPSVEYKAKFVPNQTLRPDGRWREFRS